MQVNPGYTSGRHMSAHCIPRRSDFPPFKAPSVSLYINIRHQRFPPGKTLDSKVPPRTTLGKMGRRQGSNLLFTHTERCAFFRSPHPIYRSIEFTGILSYYSGVKYANERGILALLWVLQSPFGIQMGSPLQESNLLIPRVIYLIIDGHLLDSFEFSFAFSTFSPHVVCF